MRHFPLIGRCFFTIFVILDGIRVYIDCMRISNKYIIKVQERELINIKIHSMIRVPLRIMEAIVVESIGYCKSGV